MSINKTRTMLPELNHTINLLVSSFDTLTPERQRLLLPLTEFIRNKKQANLPVYLNFICTHNSRRSHLAQVWAQAAAYYFGINQVHCFSGGTEATAFNPRAVKAMSEAGFLIEQTNHTSNPLYKVRFAEGEEPVLAFSKKYDDAFNHTTDFAAVMTCTHADENCPVIIGMEKRISLPYNDPKDFDGTIHESEKYAERVREIGSEMLYVFSNV